VFEVSEGSVGDAVPDWGGCGGAFLQRIEGRGEKGEIRDEATIVVGEAEEALKFGEGGGERPVANSVGFGGICFDAIAADNVAQEGNAGLAEETFRALGIKFVKAKAVEDGADVLDMAVEVGGEDKEIVNVDYDVFVKNAMENRLHRRLEGRGGINEAEWHDGKLENAVSGTKCGKMAVGIGYFNLVECGVEVDFGEELSALE
jgi:hypothetical protein